MEYVIHLQETGKKKIYVEPEYGEGIYLYPGEIKKQKLTEGTVISEETFFRLREEYAIPRAKKRALGILVKRDCTERELRDKLKNSLNDSFSVDRAIDFGKAQGYVDDERYAAEYLSYKRGKKSYRQIRMELMRKGISGATLDALFEEAGGQTEEDLRPHVYRYIRKFPVLDAVARQKTCAHFCRKGYAAGLVREILEEIGSEEEQAEL